MSVTERSCDANGNRLFVLHCIEQLLLPCAVLVSD